MEIRIEKPKGSKEFVVADMKGNLVKVLDALKNMNELLPAIGSEMKEHGMIILIGDSLAIEENA